MTKPLCGTSGGQAARIRTAGAGDDRVRRDYDGDGSRRAPASDRHQAPRFGGRRREVGDRLCGRVADGGDPIDDGDSWLAEAARSAAGHHRPLGVQHRDCGLIVLRPDVGHTVLCGHRGRARLGNHRWLCAPHGARPAARSGTGFGDGGHPVGPVARCSGRQPIGRHGGVAHLVRPHVPLCAGLGRLGFVERAGL